MAGCKALGLISKLVKTPLWNLMEDRKIHILDMNTHYLALRKGLQDAAQNIDQFMVGKLRPFGDKVPIKEDVVYEKLCKASSMYDGHCKAILSVILPALGKYVTEKFSSQHPGGKFANVTEDLRGITSSVEKHNKFSEQTFAYLDQLLRFKPNRNLDHGGLYNVYI